MRKIELMDVLQYRLGPAIADLSDDQGEAAIFRGSSDGLWSRSRHWLRYRSTGLRRSGGRGRSGSHRRLEGISGGVKRDGFRRDCGRRFGLQQRLRRLWCGASGFLGLAEEGRDVVRFRRAAVDRIGADVLEEERG